jgi:Domain of unknown function (DUF4336)
MDDELAPFGPGLWVGEGPTVDFSLGFAYPTRMAVIRLGNGDLFVWSPTALTPARRAAVDALGPVRHIVSPNKLHHLFMAEWKAAYPRARLYASPGLRKKRPDLAFDAELGAAPDPVWAADVDQVMVEGSFALTEIVFFHRQSRTALFTDLIQNFPPDWFTGWRRTLARLDGIVAPHPGAPREWRASFIDRKAGRAAIARILAWRIERVLVAHGTPVEANGAAFVREAMAWLAPRQD